jgi:hypothetical protein
LFSPHLTQESGGDVRGDFKAWNSMKRDRPKPGILRNQRMVQHDKGRGQGGWSTGSRSKAGKTAKGTVYP